MRVAKALWVVGFPGSGVGATSREAVIGKSVMSVLVELSPCCCSRRCPLLVAKDFGRNLVISVVVRPGKVVRWPRFMARRRVETAGLNKVPWRNAARSLLDVEASMVLQARLVLGGALGGARAVLGGSGMFQRPLVLLRGPLMMSDPSLMMCT